MALCSVELLPCTSVQVEATGKPPGMVRSPLQPEETSGLARSGDLSLMLPVEMSLIAKGWPRTVS